jgi:hypothetical protein
MGRRLRRGIRWRWMGGLRLSDFFVGVAAYVPTMLFGFWVNIRCFGGAAGGFALTASPFFRRQKGTKKLAPTYGPRRLGSLRSGIDPGAAATVCFAAPTSAVSGCARRSLRSHAPINPSAQPSDVAGDAKSKALELTLIVEW